MSLVLVPPPPEVVAALDALALAQDGKAALAVARRRQASKGDESEAHRYPSASELEAMQLQEARQTITARTRTLRGCVEPRPGTPPWQELVRDPRLRGLVERYDIARGSVLVVGSAGAGKTVGLRALVCALRAENTPTKSLRQRPNAVPAQALNR